MEVVRRGAGPSSKVPTLISQKTPKLSKKNMSRRSRRWRLRKKIVRRWRLRCGVWGSKTLSRRRSWSKRRSKSRFCWSRLNISKTWSLITSPRRVQRRFPLMRRALLPRARIVRRDLSGLLRLVAILAVSSSDGLISEYRLICLDDTMRVFALGRIIFCRLCRGKRLREIRRLSVKWGTLSGNDLSVSVEFQLVVDTISFDDFFGHGAG